MVPLLGHDHGESSETTYGEISRRGLLPPTNISWFTFFRVRRSHDLFALLLVSFSVTHVDYHKQMQRRGRGNASQRGSIDQRTSPAVDVLQ